MSHQGRDAPITIDDSDERDTDDADPLRLWRSLRENDVAMAWGEAEFEQWFLEYHASQDGRAACTACAYRRNIGEFVDDLYQDWYLSIRSTVDAMSRDGRSLPSWLNDDESARRYSLRALDNDAIDIVRQRSRLPVPASSRLDGTGNPLDELADPRHAPGEAPGGVESTLATNEGLTKIRRLLGTMLMSGTGGCPGCTAVMTVQLALAVLELLTSGSAQPGPSTVRGGTDEWDRTLYEALERVAPERVARVGGRMDPRTRQLKRRCGDCTRRLLGDVAGNVFGGTTATTDAVGHD